MPNGMEYLDRAKDAIKDVGGLGPTLSKAIAQGEEQATTRDGVIQTINEMADTLQLASDLIARELSGAITEFNRLQGEKYEVLRGYFERTADRLGQASLRRLLHEGTVCGELHKLGDRFEQPFSKQMISAVSLWENVKAFFSRSSSMSMVLHGLVEGERDYLRGFAAFLDDVRNLAEAATQTPWTDDVELQLRKQGQALTKMLRDKRTALQAKLTEIRVAADGAIAALH